MTEDLRVVDPAAAGEGSTPLEELLPRHLAACHVAAERIAAGAGAGRGAASRA